LEEFCKGTPPATVLDSVGGCFNFQCMNMHQHMHRGGVASKKKKKVPPALAPHKHAAVVAREAIHRYSANFGYSNFTGIPLRSCKECFSVYMTSATVAATDAAMGSTAPSKHNRTSKISKLPQPLPLIHTAGSQGLLILGGSEVLAPTPSLSSCAPSNWSMEDPRTPCLR